MPTHRAHSPAVCKGADCGDHPQLCVDYCDAFAYCQAVGKKLCGMVEGGPARFGKYNVMEDDRWYAACTVKPYAPQTSPYGDEYDPQICNTTDNDVIGCAYGSAPRYRLRAWQAAALENCRNRYCTQCK